MSIQKLYNVIGIMSGTSMDGVDCSFIKTNGKNKVNIICEKSYKYTDNYRDILKKIINNYNINKILTKNNESVVTKKFVKIISKFIKENKIKKKSIDYIGFSGQTIYHDPVNKESIQLGLCNDIQKELNIKVIGNFRKNDLKHGGEGAPIGATYHRYIIKNYQKKSAILNIGGISNITCIKKNNLIAFDIGPGNCIIDDITYYFYKKNFDKFGKYSFKGKINNKLLNNFKKDKFFKKTFPKSLDRNYFNKYQSKLANLKKNDAICTATNMTIESVLIAINFIDSKINKLILTGGGRKNHYLINKLKTKLKNKKIEVILIDELGFDGDMLESQAFGYLAIRTLFNLPISYPNTTGVKKPITGGIIYQ